MTLHKDRHLFNIIIFPIMILLLLSCPIKREIKQLLDIPVRNVTLGKSNIQLPTCLYETASKQENKQMYEVPEYITTTPFANVPISINILFQTQWYEKIAISLPLFIRHRKLII